MLLCSSRLSLIGIAELFQRELFMFWRFEDSLDLFNQARKQAVMSLSSFAACKSANLRCPLSLKVLWHEVFE